MKSRPLLYRFITMASVRFRYKHLSSSTPPRHSRLQRAPLRPFLLEDVLILAPLPKPLAFGSFEPTPRFGNIGLTRSALDEVSAQHQLGTWMAALRRLAEPCDWHYGPEILV